MSFTYISTGYIVYNALQSSQFCHSVRLYRAITTSNRCAFASQTEETKEEKPPSAKTITIKSGTDGDGLEEAVDLTDPELAGAATKIQAAFRGHQTRSTMKHEDKAAKSTGSQQQQQQHQQEEFENEFTSDDVELTHAATKIQASFRGHMVRKQMEKEDGDQQPQKPTPEEEELDIDLTDPELNKAATKIQASFRGHAVRKDQPGQPETK